MNKLILRALTLSLLVSWSATPLLVAQDVHRDLLFLDLSTPEKSLNGAPRSFSISAEQAQAANLLEILETWGVCDEKADQNVAECLETLSNEKIAFDKPRTLLKSLLFSVQLGAKPKSLSDDSRWSDERKAAHKKLHRAGGDRWISQRGDSYAVYSLYDPADGMPELPKATEVARKSIAENQITSILTLALGVLRAANFLPQGSDDMFPPPRVRSSLGLAHHKHALELKRADMTVTAKGGKGGLSTGTAGGAPSLVREAVLVAELFAACDMGGSFCHKPKWPQEQALSSDDMKRVKEELPKLKLAVSKVLQDVKGDAKYEDALEPSRCGEAHVHDFLSRLRLIGLDKEVQAVADELRKATPQPDLVVSGLREISKETLRLASPSAQELANQKKLADALSGLRGDANDGLLARVLIFRQLHEKEGTPKPCATLEAPKSADQIRAAQADFSLLPPSFAVRTNAGTILDSALEIAQRLTQRPTPQQSSTVTQKEATATLVTGPAEHFFFSADLPVNEIEQLEFDEANGELQPVDESGTLYLGLNYRIGDAHEKRRSLWRNLVFKVMLEASDEPWNTFGVGIGLQGDYFQGKKLGINLNAISPWIGWTFSEEDELSATGTPNLGGGRSSEFRIGLSLDLGRLISAVGGGS